jgi:SAM-dependent methyltransferase
MSSVFGTEYAGSYDLLYGDKDYEFECDLLEQMIEKHGFSPTRSILDLGCGTGNHALPLAKRGYDVVGVDRSQEMLACMRNKADNQRSSQLIYHRGDIRSVDLNRTFDVTLMMFAVLGYQTENKDVLAALGTARRHLNPGGILIFDVWHGPAVLNLRPTERAKIIPTSEGEMVRFANGILDTELQTCTVSYQIWQIKDNRILARAKESHTMRYFFPLELDFLLEFTGFTRLSLSAFPEIQRKADESTWNALIVARAI